MLAGFNAHLEHCVKSSTHLDIVLEAFVIEQVK